MKTSSRKPSAAAPLKYQPVRQVAELEGLCAAPVRVECVVGGQAISFSGRRLTRAEQRRILELLQTALPPVLPPEPGSDEPRYDLRNPEYQQAKRAAERKARALALYWAFPLFAQLVKGAAPTDDDIVAALEGSRIAEELFDHAWERLNESVVLVDQRRVGFTSGSSNPAN